MLILVHAFIFGTWIYFWTPAAGPERGFPDPQPSNNTRLFIVLAIMSVSFLVTSLIGFRLTNVLLRFFYRITAVWLAFVNYAFFSACLCWIAYAVMRLGGLKIDRRDFALVFLALAAAVTIFGLVNAAVARVRGITVKIPNLASHWRGRTAVLVSDVHLGNLRTFGFVRSIVKRVSALKPDVIFLAGDFYDGTPGDLAQLAQPLSTLSPPLGTFFVEGNHEEFRDRKQYLDAIAAAGVRVLNNEVTIVDGLQVIGVTYWDASHGEHFRKTLRATGFNRAEPSILLTHAPDHLQVSAEEGISLQLSGHTHRGQFWPWTLAAKQMYGKFVHGLQSLGALQVYTSCGVGTWGPPVRVGTSPEIVLIRFECVGSNEDV